MKSKKTRETIVDNKTGRSRKRRVFIKERKRAIKGRYKSKHNTPNSVVETDTHWSRASRDTWNEGKRLNGTGGQTEETKDREMTLT